MSHLSQRSTLAVDRARAEPAPDRGLIVLVDDTEELRRFVSSVLRRDGYDVESFACGEDCLMAMARLMPDAIFLDLDMPGLGGLATLERIRSKNQRVPVTLLTADDRVESVVAAMKLGAYDYLVKPAVVQKLLTVARNAVEHYRMSVELTSLHREVGDTAGYPEIVSQAASMKQIFQQMDRVAATDITLLIHGESGTGKELVARAIHAHSVRRAGPFVALNCAAIPETLQESEVFGHEKGAFTGAIGRRIGKFEHANKGTLFLDEVGELGLPLQAKLLRVLQDNTFQRVGGSQEIRSDFRLIAATHRDLAREVRAGNFREDLFFRIVVFELELPPLAKRIGDVDLLTAHFLDQYRDPAGAAAEISSAARDLLRAHSWPGNVRELQNVIQRTVVCAEEGVIEPHHLPDRIRERGTNSETVESQRESVTPDAEGSGRDNLNLEQLEQQAIQKALDRTGGNVAQVGRLLGVSRATLYRKLKKYTSR